MLTVILLVLFLVAFVVFFYKTSIKPHSYWTNRGVLQGKSIWLFGDNWKLVSGQECLTESFRRIYNKFPNVRYFGTYQFNNPLLVIRDPELIKLITIKDFEHFIDHRLWLPEESDPLWTRNLFSLQGEQWKEMRTFLSPAFTGRKMRTMFSLMETTAQNFNKYLEEDKRDLLEVDFKDYFHRYACDVLASTAFGLEVNSLKNKDNEFYQLAKEAADFSGFKMLSFFANFFLPQSLIKFLKIRIFSKKIEEFFTKLVVDTIKIREERNIARPDMLHLMMEARKGRHEYVAEEDNDDGGFASSKVVYSSSMPKTAKLDLNNSDLAAQAMVFIVGGMDTVATLLCFMAYELAVHPEIQDKLRDEINDTSENFEGSVSYEDLQKMKYMDMVVSESLRKWTSASTLERVCSKPYTIPAQEPNETEMTIETGTLVWIPVVGIHYDSRFYPDPEKFDPERFSDENKRNIHPYTYIPFGEGPRNCIGNRYAILEAKVMFFNLLKSFEIIPVEKSCIPIKLKKSSFTLDGENHIYGLKKIK